MTASAPPRSRLSLALIAIGAAACLVQVLFVRSQSPGLLLSAAMWVPTAFAIVVIWVSAATVRPWGRGPWVAVALITTLMPLGLAVRRILAPNTRTAFASEVGTVETLYIVGYLLAALAFVGLLAKVRQRPEPISAVDSALVFAVIVTIGYVAVLQPLARRDIQVGLALETLFLLVDALLAALIVRLWLSSSARFNRALRTMLVAVAIFVVDDMVATYFTVNTTVRAEWEGVFLGFVVLSMCLAAASWRDPTIVNYPAGSLHAGRLAVLRAALVGLLVVPAAAGAAEAEAEAQGWPFIILAVLIAILAVLVAVRGVLVVRVFQSMIARSELLRAAGEQISRADDDNQIVMELTAWGSRVLGSDSFALERTQNPGTAENGQWDGSSSALFRYRTSAPDGEGFLSLHSAMEVPLDQLDWSATQTLVEMAGDRSSRLALERQRTRAAEQARNSVLMAGSMDMVVLVDDAGRIREALGAVARMGPTGATLGPGGDVLELFEEPQPVAELLHRSAPARGRVTANLVGSDTVVEVTVMNLDSGEATVSLHDITDRVRLVRALNHRANHDELTGLLNRTGFALAAAEAEANFLADATPFGIALIDVVDFHLANDSLGHDAGDAILIEAARRMIDSVGDGATVARLGGDEFALLVIGDESDIARAARSALAAFDEPMHPSDVEFTARANAGVAVGSTAMATGGRTLQAADLALAVSKTTSADQMVFFRPGMREAVLDRMAASSAVAMAARRREFRFDYQPVVDAVDGRVVGVEALMRWDQGGRWRFPDKFIPVAESLGELTSIFRAALGPALAQFARWREDYPDLIMNLNAHAGMLDDELSRWLPREAARAGLPLAALALELTERSLVPVQANASLGTLHDQGLGVYIDDFGTGWSNLSYLAGLPVSGVKIAREMGFGEHGDEIRRPLISAAVALAQAFDLDIVAEGVETVEQLQAARELGVHKIQGYFFARPMPPGQMTEWLQTTHAVMPVDC